MPPRLSSRQIARAANYVSRSSNHPIALVSRFNARNSSTNDYSKLPKKETPGPGPNSESLPHVTEEAAAMGKITGDRNAPDTSQGTPVEEVKAFKQDMECG